MEQIGYVKKIHGIKGALVLKLLSKFHFLGKAKDALFIEQHGSHVPYFIDEIGGGHPEWIIKLNEVGHADAEKMVGAKVSALPDKFVIEKSIVEEYQFLIGFIFLDVTSQKQGVIVEIEEMTFQTILYINIDDKEILVPLNIDWIVEINKAEKKIQYTCPEGLVDVYLS
jgi:16S rRNA processing protein RimM